jgi:PAS domain S-box-containing protein
MNEALMLGSVRQHELTEAAEILNARLQEEIAARTKTARELAEKARLLDLTRDAIVVRGLDEKISLWNKGAEDLFGWTTKEMIGKQLHTVLKTEFPKPKEEIIAQLHREGQFSGEVVQIARDGRCVPSLCRWVLDADTESILTSYTDLTEYKAIEDELRQVTAQFTRELEETVKVRTAELSETIGHLETFSYTIVHDLRAPLRAMQGFGKMLAEDCGPRVGPQGLDYIERIVNSAHRMDRLIQDVLNYSGMARGEMKLEPLDPHKLLQGMIESYPSLQPPCGEIRIQGRLPVLLANEAALTQTFSNLLENAFKFVGPGIIPEVHVWSEPSMLAGLPSAKIYVQDNGLGIAKEYQKTIFGIFQRLSHKSHGTGIGLAIVAKAVERMGGKVGLQSEPGKGSTFWLELKRVPAKGHAEAAPKG